MSRLARRNRVLWVEPPLSLLTPLRKPPEWSNLWRRGTRQPQSNLFTLATINPLPLSRFGAVRRLNRAFRLRRLREAMERLDFRDPILWVHFNWALEHFIGQVGEKLVCYDCFDKYTGFVDPSGGGHQAIQDWEKEVVQQAQVIFATAPSLCHYLEEMQPSGFPLLVPNGVDVALFRQATGPNAPLPEDLRNIKRPVVGVAGSIGQKIDLALLHHIAISCPQWSLVIIGPVEPEADRRLIAALRSLPNVHFLGSKDFRLLPFYLGGIDVALVPFRQDYEEVHYTMVPNRLWECLAAGRPAVSVPLENISQYDGLVYVAQDGPGFVAAIQSALGEAETGQEMVRRRQAAVAEHDWDNRAEQMSAAIQSALSGAKGGAAGARKRVL